MPGGADFLAKYQKRFKGIKFDAPFAYDASTSRRRDEARELDRSGEDPRRDAGDEVRRRDRTTTFDSKGDLTHGIISIYGYKSGKKTFVDR